MKKVIYTLALIAIGYTSFAQSSTVKSFSEEAEGYNLYLYQSLIRMLNKDQNPDFNMLIRDLDHLKFVTSSKTPDAERDRGQFQSLDEGIVNEGFETIMSIDNKDYILHLHLLENRGSKTHWVATFMMQGMTGVMEMKGELDTKYLHAFSSLNYEQLESLLSLDKKDDEVIVEWD